MITINLYYTGVNGAARAFAEEMVRSGTAAAVRAEEGNLRYAYFFPMDAPETVLERLAVYHEKTEPLKAFYEKQGKLFIVEGQEQVEDTTALTLRLLEE